MSSSVSSRTQALNDLGTALLPRLQRGEEQAFIDFYTAFSGPLTSIGRHLLQREEDVEDLVQEVLVEALSSLDTFNHRRGSLLGWLVGILRHRAVDRARILRRRYREIVATHQLAEAIEHEDLAAQVQQRVDIRELLRELPDRERDVVYLHYFLGLPYSEVADRLGISTVAARQYASRARDKLRARITGETAPSGC
jgi:RNA polymerase sigma-70 factor, ECF subfamily